MTTEISREQFLRALRTHPEWREEVRKEILGEELLRLPVAFRAFVEKQEQFNEKQEQFNEKQEQFNEKQERFNEKQERFNDEMRAFRDEATARFERIDERFDRIDARFDRMERDNATLKNATTESDALKLVDSICEAAHCSRVNILTSEDKAQLLQTWNDPNLARGDRDSFRRADIILEAEDDGNAVYLVVEVSFTADQRDLRRATRNARLLTEHTGARAIPVVAGVRYDNEIRQPIDDGEIIWFQTDDEP